MLSSRYIQSIATQSLGRAWHHKLDTKLEECARHGFQAIELFMEDLEYVAKELPYEWPSAEPGTSFANSCEWDERRLAAADYIHHLCTVLDLQVICLQPFMHYDGLIDRPQHAARIRELHVWIQLAKRLSTDLIQVPSSFLPKSECTGDRAIIVADLQEIADIGLQHFPPIRFAYEALCWGTHVNQWNEAWEIVEAVDRPNFGTCLDTFNLAGRVYADPEAMSGKTSSAYQDLQDSLNLMRQTLDISKVFYVEFCDGERLDHPISEKHEWYVASQPARMTWSRNARLFPFEERGYLPVLEVLETILDLGFEGHIAYELFSRTANVAGDSVPGDHARRGRQSWVRLMQHLEQRELQKRGLFQSRIRMPQYDESQPTFARL